MSTVLISEAGPRIGLLGVVGIMPSVPQAGLTKGIRGANGQDSYAVLLGEAAA